jgi:eukaryotic-like serine/threonine-protein kinase
MKDGPRATPSSSSFRLHPLSLPFMDCPNCHSPLREGTQFCTACGARTAHGAAAPSDSIPTVERDPGAGGGGGQAGGGADALVGRVLDGKYEIVARLGEGGMGSVYRARRVHIGDEVAVKVLHARFVDDETLVERFRREARAAAQLQHPNVVTIHDYGEARGPEGFAYIVMELVRGLSLRELLRREGRLGAARAVGLMRDVCAGVGAAHRRGIVHRDIKPDNIIVMPPDGEGEPERVKVVDFGIAKLRDMAGDSALTQAGAMVGTPFYMSPEQCRGESLDARSDVYSLGALLYEMLAGRPPFTAPSITGVISKHLTEPPPPVPEQLDVPGALRAAVARALAKDPAARQRDATEFAREVQAAGSGELGPARSAVQTRPAPAVPVFGDDDDATALSVTPAPPAAPPSRHAPQTPAPQTHSPQPHAPQTHPPPPAPQTHAQHTFNQAPPRGSGAGRVLLVLGVVAVLAAGVVMLALVGLYSLGADDSENRPVADRGRGANLSTPAPANVNSNANGAPPSGENRALADRLAVPEGKILSGVELTAADLAGLGPEELRVLRNAPFARHGRVFQDARLQGYFESRPWYTPDPDFDEGDLEPADRANAVFVRRYEEGGPDPTPADTATVAREVGTVVAEWAASTSARDLGAHMNHYAPTLETYYQRRDVPSSAVRSERARAFARYDQMDVELRNVEVAPDPTGTRATVTFDKDWEFDSDSRTSTGSVKQQLTLTRIGGRWLITGERDLQVYFTNSEER